MVLGSVPMAFLGAYLLHLMGHAKTAQSNIETALGAALLLGAAAMVLRYVLDRRGGQDRTGVVHEVVPHPVRTIAIGMVGGIVVGMTSVGLRLADDHPAAVPLPDARGQPARGHRSEPGGAADGSPRRSGRSPSATSNSA